MPKKDGKIGNLPTSLHSLPTWVASLADARVHAQSSYGPLLAVASRGLDAASGAGVASVAAKVEPYKPGWFYNTRVISVLVLLLQ